MAMDKLESNIFLIGNGFDLSHKMRTSYTHFIEYCIELINYDKEESKQLVQWEVRPRFKKNNDPNNFLKLVDYHSYKPGFKNDFFFNLLEDNRLKNWCDIEQFYFRELQSSIDDKDKVEKLNNEFEVIKTLLEGYLSSEEQRFELDKKMYFLFFTRYIKKGDLILNFNYTNTIERYLEIDKIESTETIYIHGKLNDPNNRMIFGYAPDENDTKAIIKKDDPEFTKNIKMFSYNDTDNFTRLREYLAQNKNINVFVIGHSCGYSDRLILSQIFSHTNVKNIRLFYFRNKEYLKTIHIRIARILDDIQVNYLKINNNNRSFIMPQKEYEDDYKEYCKQVQISM